ncbi:MAG TPA: diguanylate cyclase [Azoarcus taiwanensis]|nr:diguanylate cyclase [Azoarcus taiwanensis]
MVLITAVLVAAASLALMVVARSLASMAMAFWVALAIGGVAGFMTHRHVRTRGCVREKTGSMLSGRLELLEQELPRFEIGLPERASAEMLDRMEAAVERADLLRRIADGMHDVEALFHMDGRLIWISPSVKGLTGYSPEECAESDDPIALLVHEPDLGFCKGAIRRAAERPGKEVESFEMRLEHREGAVRWVACQWRRMERDGEPVGLRMSAQDVQDRKEAEYRLLETVAELRRSRALSEHYLARSNDERMRLTALLDAIRLGILFMDRDHRALYVNRPALEIWGFRADENLIGVRDVVLQSRVATLLQSPDAYFRHVADVLSGEHDGAAVEVHLKDGRVITEMSAVVGKGVDGRGLGRVWIYEDVTAQREIAHRLVELAERDPLTDLFNRRRFHEELERVLADASRREFEVGLLLFDLDGFKPINDAFGHQAGDDVLVTIARRVGGIIRRNETFFRLGGDEFAVLVPDADDAGLQELARRIVEGVAALSFEFDGQPASLTASLGIGLFPRHARDGERLVAVADAAMYRAKEGGRNRWVIGEPARSESDRMRSSHDETKTLRRED